MVNNPNAMWTSGGNTYGGVRTGYWQWPNPHPAQSGNVVQSPFGFGGSPGDSNNFGGSGGGGMSQTGQSAGQNTSQQQSWNNSQQSSKSHDQALTDTNQAQADAFIQQLLSGGTEEQKREIANRNATQALIQSQLGNYTTTQAMADARGAMSQQLRQSLEKNMPAMARGVEGAGSSSGSMQALLANDLSTRAAESAATVGAQQAQAYAVTTANIDSVLERISQPMNLAESTLVGALGAVKGPHSDSESQGSSTGGSSGSSQGTNQSTSMGFNPEWWYVDKRGNPYATSGAPQVFVPGPVG